ncbi:hypothetical protein LCGC14_0759730 [marine sediment metagenome]|uniref:Lipoprotein n=1 Tax=marine sediment metagenome TaxID=412755 RepID=A0A0F9T8L6_9ZZZZ
MKRYQPYHLTLLPLLIIALLLAACVPIQPPPQMLQETHRAGAMRGCVRAIVTLHGTPPTYSQAIGLLRFCQKIAADLQPLPSSPTPLPLPETLRSVCKYSV